MNAKKLARGGWERLCCFLPALALSYLGERCPGFCTAFGSEEGMRAFWVGTVCLSAMAIMRVWDAVLWYRNSTRFRPLWNAAEEVTEPIFVVEEEDEVESQTRRAPVPAPDHRVAVRYDSEKIWSHVFGIGVASYFLVHSTQFQTKSMIYACTASWALVLIIHYADAVRAIRSSGESLRVVVRRQKWRHASLLAQMLLVLGCAAAIVHATVGQTATQPKLYETPTTIIAALVPFLYLNAATSHGIEADILETSSPVTAIVSLCGLLAIGSSKGFDGMVIYATKNTFRTFNMLVLSPLCVLIMLHSVIGALRKERVRLVVTSLVLVAAIQSTQPAPIALAACAFAVEAFMHQGH